MAHEQKKPTFTEPDLRTIKSSMPSGNSFSKSFCVVCPKSLEWEMLRSGTEIFALNYWAVATHRRVSARTQTHSLSTNSTSVLLFFPYLCPYFFSACPSFVPWSSCLSVTQAFAHTFLYVCYLLLTVYCITFVLDFWVWQLTLLCAIFWWDLRWLSLVGVQVPAYT